MFLLAKGQASPSWTAFLLPPAHVGFREEVGTSVPSGDSVSPPLLQRQPFPEAHPGSSGSNSNKNTGGSAMTANQQTSFYPIPYFWCHLAEEVGKLETSNL